MQVTTALVVAGVLLAAAPTFAQRRRPAEPYEPKHRIESQVFKKAPQGELSIQLHFPEGWTAKDKRPAIVFFFGGGWTGGNVRQFLIQADYFAGRGMVAARADYRVKGRHGTTPDKCVEDGKSAVRWLRKNAAKLGIDPERIVSSGGSAGGHVAACTATTKGLEAKGEDATVSSRPNLLVLFNPVMNCSGERMAKRIPSAEIAKQISPNLLLSKDTVPATVFFGTKDSLFGHGREFIEKSAEAGNEADLHTAEGQSHGFFNRPPWRQRTIYLTDEFLARHGYLKGKPTVELPDGKLAMEKYSPRATAPAGK